MASLGGEITQKRSTNTQGAHLNRKKGSIPSGLCFLNEWKYEENQQVQYSISRNRSRERERDKERITACKTICLSFTSKWLAKPKRETRVLVFFYLLFNKSSSGCFVPFVFFFPHSSLSLHFLGQDNAERTNCNNGTWCKMISHLTMLKMGEKPINKFF